MIGADTTKAQTRTAAVSGRCPSVRLAHHDVMSGSTLRSHRNVDAVHPWDPVSADQVALPDTRITPAWVAERFTRQPDDFSLLLRAHLVPARKKDSRYIRQWRALWRSVAFLDRRMRSRVLAMLQTWRDQAVDELDAGAAADENSPEQRVLSHFVSDVEGAVARIRREGRTPMAWAGNDFVDYPPTANARIEALVIAIDEHRAQHLTDEQLHRLLGILGLDPNAVATESEVSEDARARVLQAARTGEPLDLRR